MEHKGSEFYPFCCEEDSLSFNDLFLKYSKNRFFKSGHLILKECPKEFEKLTRANLDFLIRDWKLKIVDLHVDIIYEAEEKFHYLVNLIFLYYLKLVFKKISKNFDKNKFLKYIKFESLESHLEFSSNTSEWLLKIISFIFADIKIVEDIHNY